MDDDPAAQHIIGAHLARDGYRLLFAGSGQEALTMARKHRPDAITLDIMRQYLIGLPAMVTGLWVGFKLYGKLDDAAFRKILLVLLLVAGLGLIVARLR